MGRKTVIPQRLTLSRAKGFNLQQHSMDTNGLPAMLVSRPSKWGNPFRCQGGDMIYINAKHRRSIFDPWVYVGQGNMHSCVQRFAPIMKAAYGNSEYSLPIFHKDSDCAYWVNHFKSLDISEIKGKNLACWCKQGQPCHANTLLRWANRY